MLVILSLLLLHTKTTEAVQKTVPYNDGAARIHTVSHANNDNDFLDPSTSCVADRLQRFAHSHRRQSRSPLK